MGEHPRHQAPTLGRGVEEEVGKEEDFVEKGGVGVGGFCGEGTFSEAVREPARPPRDEQGEVETLRLGHLGWGVQWCRGVGVQGRPLQDPGIDPGIPFYSGSRSRKTFFRTGIGIKTGICLSLHIWSNMVIQGVPLKSTPPKFSKCQT